MMQYSDFHFLAFEHRQDGVLSVTLNRPMVMNAINARLHWELGKIWGVLAEDPHVRVVVLSGSGDRAFSAGGDLDWVRDTLGDPSSYASSSAEVDEIVVNMLRFEKPVISAINGVAVGAGLLVALMADISIMAEEAKISDGHAKIGLPANDDGAILWLSLCGMAKAKYYLMTAQFIDGKEAERIGLVSLCVPLAALRERALAVAHDLAVGSQSAVRHTKRSLNKLVQASRPAFDAQAAVATFMDVREDAMEGVLAIHERRTPDFPSGRI